MAKNTAGEKKHLCENMSFIAHEAFKKMRTNTIIALPQNNNCKVIGITSAQPGEGKTTSSINLAYTFSELGKKVLLVDADLHLPTVADKLLLNKDQGFVELLTVTKDVASVRQIYNDSNSKACFDVIAGGVTENSSELLSSSRLSHLMEALSKAYDYIFIDLPPIGAVIDAVILGKYTDGMIVVARENRTMLDSFDNCINQLEFADIRILGIVVNGSADGTTKKYSYNYHSYK